MSAVPFGTLKFALHLEASGMTASVASGAAEALADAMTGADLPTKRDLAATTTDLRTEIASVRTELKSEIAGVRAEIAATRIELKNDIELSRRDITIKFGGMTVLAVGILLTAIRYLPPHP